MARTGVFDDLDVCLHWHPNDQASVFNVRSAANIKLNVELSRTWPSITKRKPAPADADEWKDVKDKLSELIR